MRWICFLVAATLFFTNGAYGQPSNEKDTTRNANTMIRQCVARFPKKAEENNISGSVELMFDMDSNCAFVNFRIIKSLGYGCDEAAISAIRDCRIIHRGGNAGTCKPIYNLRQTIRFIKPGE